MLKLKRKLIYVIIISAFCTGCTINYELNIDRKMNFDETIKVTGNITEYGIDEITDTGKKLIIRTNESWLIDTEGYDFVKNEVNNKKYSVQVDGTKQKIENIKDSKIILKLYDEININKKTNGNYTFSFSKNNKYDNEEEYDGLNFDKLIISVKSKKKIINSNADKINKDTNTYIWNVSNSNMKKIYFEVTNKNIFEKKYYYLIVLIPLSVILIYLTLKSKKVNEIK